MAKVNVAVTIMLDQVVRARKCEWKRAVPFPCFRWLVVCLTLLFAPPPSVAQGPPVPEYYGVFLWDGRTLQELKKQERRPGPPFTQPLELSSVKTSNLRPSFVIFDRRLRAVGPPAYSVKPVKYVVQKIVFGYNKASCFPADYWGADDRSAIETRSAPAGSNPELARIVLVSDLAPGWYALSSSTSVFTFGAQVDSLDPKGALAESFQHFGDPPGLREGLHPVGTYTGARGSEWKCSSR